MQNRRLEEDRRVFEGSEIKRRSGGEDWRSKIEILQKEQSSYEMQIK